MAGCVCRKSSRQKRNVKFGGAGIQAAKYFAAANQAKSKSVFWL
jgi:hypothetical protein